MVFRPLNFTDRNRNRTPSSFQTPLKDSLIAKHLNLVIFVGNFQLFKLMQEKDGKYIFGVVKVGDKGQIVIPRDARRQYDIKPGDALLLLGDQNGMALVKTQIFEDLIGQVMEGMTK